MRPALLLSEIFPPKPGGSGRWFWEVYRRMPPGRAVIAAGEDPGQEAFDRTHDLRLVRLPLTFRTWGVANPRGAWNYWRVVRRLRRLVRAERVGAVHCGRCLPEGLIGLALRNLTGVPYLCYAHGEELNYARHSRELRWLMRRVFSGAGLVIANSSNTLGLLRGEWGLPAERTRLLHPGVDTVRFAPAERSPAVRERLGWGDRPVVLTVGRLQKRKGHDMLIRALPAVRRAVPEVLYAIVGGGEERRALEELVAREGLGCHVQFLGELDDEMLVKCYQQCDLFALPNREVRGDIEGFGMVLLEAQACGKPVLAGASGGTAETMRVPETGRIVACDEPGPLAQALSELLVDRYRLANMGNAGRRWTVEHFDWSALACQAQEVFRTQGVTTGAGHAYGAWNGRLDPGTHSPT